MLMLINYMSQTRLLIIQENPVALRIYEMVIFEVVFQQVQTGVLRVKQVKSHVYFIFLKRTDISKKNLCRKNSKKTYK